MSGLAPSLRSTGLLALSLLLLTGCSGGEAPKPGPVELGKLGAACASDAECGGLECALGSCRLAPPCPAGTAEVAGACYGRSCGQVTCTGSDYCVDAAAQTCGDPRCKGTSCESQGLACDPQTGSCVACSGADGVCPEGTRCQSGQCTCMPSEAAESTCGDGRDGDCDGKVDCADSDCAQGSCGPGGATCSGALQCACPGNEPAEATCSDGKDNDCDGLADCEDPDCEAQTCRGAAGVCDQAETCSAGVCPADLLLDAGTTCREAAGACDVAETCTGEAAACPADALASASVVCRQAAGVCDAAETCTGSSAQCPVDHVAPAGVTCRPGAGACDVPEACNGASQHCPYDTFSPPGTQCRAGSGDVQCNPAESCTGASALCPPDVRNAECSGGSCCADLCIDTQWDRNNCGGCGFRCPVTQQCVEGTCLVVRDPNPPFTPATGSREAASSRP